CLVCETQAAVVHLLDEARHEYTAISPDGATALPLDACFCSHSSEHTGLVVPDLRADSRLRDHILISSEPHLRFYAGYPLITNDGERIGSLCIRGQAPRQLTQAQQRALGVLA